MVKSKGFASLVPKQKSRLEFAFFGGVNFHKIFAEYSSDNFFLLFDLLHSWSNTVQRKKIIAFYLNYLTCERLNRPRFLMLNSLCSVNSDFTEPYQGHQYCFT